MSAKTECYGINLSFESNSRIECAYGCVRFLVLFSQIISEYYSGGELESWYFCSKQKNSKKQSVRNFWGNWWGHGY